MLCLQLFVDHDRLLWSVHHMGWWIWKASNLVARHCQEEKRRKPEDGLAGKSSSQKTSSKAWPDEKVRGLLHAATDEADFDWLLFCCGLYSETK